MHIKRLLSGSLAALMVASSFNVPVVRAAEDEPTEVVEEAKVDTSGDDDVIVDDVPEVETEETTEVSEPEEVTGLVEETSDEGTTEETLVVEEETKEQEVVKGEATGFAEGAKAIVAFVEDTDATFPTIDAEGIAISDSKFAIAPATKTGYTFTGYTVSCDDSDVTGAYDAGYVTLTDANSTRDAQLSTVNVTLTAQWSEWTRPVTYDLNYETTDSAPTGKTINWSDTVAAVGPATAPTREGYTLEGWSTSNSATNGMAGNEIVTAADQESVVLYAIWKENTSEAIDITGNTFTYSITTADDKALTYTGSAISPKVVVKNGDDVVDPSNYEVKYFANSDCSGEEATLKDAGTYYAKITAKGTAYTGEKKGVEVKVARLPLTKNDITLTVTGSWTGNEDDGFTLFYDTETKAAEGSKPATVKGVTAKEVKPLVFVEDSENNPIDIADTNIAYANNNVVSTDTTKASVTITLTAEQLKNYQIGDSETATTLTKEFTIKDGEEDEFIDVVSENTKATISNTDSKAGKAVAYGKIYGKKLESEIAPVALNTIQLKIAKTSEAYLPNGNIGAFLDPIKDTNGEDITDQFDFDKELTEDGAKLILTAKEDSNLYEGSYEYSYKFVDEECTEHTWVRKVIPATFEAKGAWWYECSACGERATNDDITEIKKQLGLDELTAVSDDIDKLDATKISFWIHNNPDVLNTTDTRYNFHVVDGKVGETALKDFKVNDYGKTISLSNVKLGNIERTATKTNEDGEEVTVENFKVSLTNAAAGKDAKVKVVFADDYQNGDYAGATAEWTFKVVEAPELVEIPNIKNHYYGKEYSYGNKIELATATPGASIYYFFSTPKKGEEDEEGYVAKVDPTTRNELIALINAGKATKYESAIKLDRDSHLFVEASTDEDNPNYKLDTVKLNMIAVKGDGYSEFYPAELKVTDPTQDWGEVVEGYDTYVSDATKIPDGLWISDWMMESLDDVYGKVLTYSGFAKTFKAHDEYGTVTGDMPTSAYRVFFKNKLLTYGADYTIKITNNVNAANMDSAKAPTITITGKGEYAGGTIKTFTIKPEEIADLFRADDPTTDFDESTIQTYESPVYWDGKLTVTENGKIQKPKYTATNRVSGRKLAENKDFTVDYSQVLASATPDGEAGYPITFTGKGNYTGTMTNHLRVVSAGRSLEKAKLTIDTSNVKFDGTDQINNLITTVTLGDQELKRGTDYAVTVYQQDDWTRNSRVYGHASELYSNGKYSIRIYGLGDFAGSISKIVNIKVKGTPAITTASLAPSATKVPSTATTAADGEYIDITATANGKALTEGDDYVVVFSNNKKVGTAKATVYGVGAYTGSKAFSYKIEATKITASMFAKSDKEGIYNGNAKTPDVMMYVPSTNENTEDEFVDILKVKEGTTKVEGENFIITYPKDMVNAGVKKITVKGTGAYSGTVTLKYEIKKAKTADALTSGKYNSGLKLSTDTSDSAVPEQSYTNAGFTPEFNSFGAANSYSNYSKWVKDNFTITYKKPKTGFAAGNEITVTVKGKKNFTNDVVTGVYKVAQADISYFAATVPDIVEAAKFNKGPAVSIVNYANKKLAAGEKKDYVVSYLYNGNNGHAKYSTVDAKDAVVAGTEYIARFSGKNGYKGTKDVVFKAMGKKFDLKNAKVQILGTYIFDEKNPVVLLDKENIIVTLNGEKLADANYEIVEYTKNDTVGTATVKLHGLTSGKTIVGGYKTATFKIQKASMNYMVDFKADLDDKVTKTLTITGSTKTLSSNKNNVFTLPKSGFKATLKGADGKTVNYVLKAWVDKEADETYGPGDSFVDEYAPGQVKTLYAQFVPANADNKLTVKFMSNGTGTSKVESGKMTEQVIKPGVAAKLKANAFKMDGYAFKGWTTTKNPALNAQVQYWNKDNIYNGGEKASTLELYPVFTENYYTVKYNYAGGSAPAVANEAFYLFNSKEQTIAKNIPVREGYKFTGWKAGKLESTDDKGLKIPASTKGNLTLTAKWEPLQYKVDFYNGATKINGIALAGPYTVGKDAVLMPAAPAVDGKTFLGWARADKSVVAQFKEAKSYKTLVPTAAETPATGTATVKLYAVYSTTQHTITYDLNGADARFTSQGVRKYAKADTEGLVGKLATASRPGYTFEGWALTADATTALTGLKDKDEDLTLYAVWKAAAEDIITLDANGGTISKATTFKVKLGESAEIPAVNGDETDAVKVTKANYVFQGWATAENPTKVAYGNGATFVNKTGGAQTLYAVWAPESFALHLDTDGGIIAAGYVRYNTFNVETEEFVLPTTAWISKDNYTFEGWAVGTKNDKDEITYATTGNENVTIATGTFGEKYYKALWSADSYTVTIDLAGGSLETADSTKWSDNKESYTVETKSDAAVKLPTPKKDAHTFAGWQQMKGSENVGELAAEVTVDPSTAANVKYVAKWIPNKYTITLDVNGGEISDKYVAYTTEDSSSGKKFDIKPSSGAIEYIFDAPVESSITLPTGQQITKEHATFAGWIPGTKGTGTDGKITYSGEAVASVVINDAANAKDLYFQAKWTDVGKAEVTFNANFIESGKTAADTSKEEVFVGDALPANTWSREGYTFLGWNTDKDATTASVKDKAASTYASATTLYAIWAENTVVVTFNGNGGTLSPEQTITIKYSDAATKENAITAVATRDGYDFAKWSTKRTGTDSDLAADAKIKNEGIFAVPKDKQVTKITLYATWTAKNLTATLTLNGGTLDDSIVATTATAGKYVVAEDKATATTSFTADAALVLPTAITRTGYTFDGWYDKQIGTEGAKKVTKIAKGTTAATTVYAKWIPWTVTVTFDVNGGTGSVEDITFKTGDTTPELPDSTGVTAPDGKTFGGWSTTKDDPNTKVTSLVAPTKANDTVTLYAIWEDQ